MAKKNPTKASAESKKVGKLMTGTTVFNIPSTADRIGMKEKAKFRRNSRLEPTDVYFVRAE